MTAAECLHAVKAAGQDFQCPINVFVDEFRRAPTRQKTLLIAAPIESSGPFEGLISAVVSALCREVDLAVPDWVAETGSPEPFFPFPAKSYEMRVRLLFESPPAFRVRNVFVPENYLSRA